MFHADPPWYRQVNREQWRAFFAAFFGWLLNGFDFTIMTFILIDIQDSFTIDRALAGALGSITLLFRLVGGLGAGMAADRWGRKLPLMLSVLWFSVFAFLSGFSTSYATLFACRALFGIGMGGEWAAGMPLALEHWPTRYRGLASGLLQGAWYWGYILSALIFHYVYPLFVSWVDPLSAAPGSTLAWRVMFWTGVIPVLLVLWIRASVSESPVWLDRQRWQAAGGEPSIEDRISVLRLLRRDLLGVTVQTSLLIGAFMVSYYSISFWYPTFLRETGRDPLGYLIAFNAAAIVGTTLWGRASETWLGRRGCGLWGGAHRRGVGVALSCGWSVGTALARRAVDGRDRCRHLGHGAGILDRTVSHVRARGRSGTVLPRRCSHRVSDAADARATARCRDDPHRRDAVFDCCFWARCRWHCLARAGDARAAVCCGGVIGEYS